MDSSIVLGKVLVIFLLLLTGFTARRLKIFDSTVTRGLCSIIIKITLPALTIVSMQMNFSPKLLSESIQLIGISISVYAVSLLIALALPFLLRPRQGEKGVFQFAVIFSNIAFMGYPIIRGLFGEKALFYAVIYNLPFNFLAFTLGVFLLMQDRKFTHTIDTRSNVKISIWQILNPGVISAFIGFLLFILNIHLPTVLKEPLQLIGNVTIPMSMFVTGAMLAQNSLKKVFANWRIYILAGIRLLIMPIILWVVLHSIIENRLLLGIIILLCGMPTAASTSILAQEYGGNSETAAQIVFLSTMLSVFTIPLLAILLT